jgi:hypothetical protein
MLHIVLKSKHIATTATIIHSFTNLSLNNYYISYIHIHTSKQQYTYTSF